MKKTIVILTLALFFGLLAVSAKMKDVRSKAHASQHKPSPSRGNPLNPKEDAPFTAEVEEFVKKFQGAGEGVDGAGSAKALSPEESLKRFRVSDGLAIEIVASEPVIRQPIHMHFDERGGCGWCSTSSTLSLRD